MNAYQYVNPYLTQGYMPYQQPAQQTGIVWVHGEQEASAYPVAPNNAVALWDSDSPVIYLKQADASGKPVLKMYDLVERTQVKEQETDGYATKSDVAALMKALSDMREELRKKEEDE